MSCCTLLFPQLVESLTNRNSTYIEKPFITDNSIKNTFLWKKDKFIFGANRDLCRDERVLGPSVCFDWSLTCKIRGLLGHQDIKTTTNWRKKLIGQTNHAGTLSNSILNHYSKIPHQWVRCRSGSDIEPCCGWGWWWTRDLWAGGQWHSDPDSTGWAGYLSPPHMFALSPEITVYEELNSSLYHLRLWYMRS